MLQKGVVAWQTELAVPCPARAFGGRPMCVLEFGVPVVLCVYGNNARVWLFRDIQD